jgi:uncharacterized protein YukE
MMTIQAWNIVLNAVVAVMVVAYGIWLKNIVTQQLNSKDTAIDALNAVIKVKDAEISALKSDTAPAIATAYKVMLEHADKMTAEVNRLSEQLRKAAEEQRQMSQAMNDALERDYQDVKERLEQWKKTLPEEILIRANERFKLTETRPVSPTPEPSGE